MIVAVVLDLSVTGFLKFGCYVVKCGGIPVTVLYIVSYYGNAHPMYLLPGKHFASSVHAKYFCNESEARDASYTRDPLQGI